MNVQIKTSTTLLPLFFRLLTGGFEVRTTIGINLPELICGQLEIPGDYLDHSIQTVFLEGRPVDNLEQTVVEDGSVIALSAAMPGLVGATMRRGGFYASLRQSISYRPEEKEITPQKGTITLKFFNSIVRDLGPRFLSQGVRVYGKNLSRLLRDIGDLMESKESRFFTNESEISMQDLLTGISADKIITVQILSDTVAAEPPLRT